jgi:hypothetical protein
MGGQLQGTLSDPILCWPVALNSAGGWQSSSISGILWGLETSLRRDHVVTKDSSTNDTFNRQLEDLQVLARQVTKRTRYSIDSFAQLSHALGGSGAHLTLGDDRYALEQIAAFIPNYYFPIASEEDFLAKAATLLAQYTHAPILEEPPGERVDVPIDLDRLRRAERDRPMCRGTLMFKSFGPGESRPKED